MFTSLASYYTTQSQNESENDIFKSVDRDFDDESTGPLLPRYYDEGKKDVEAHIELSDSVPTWDGVLIMVLPIILICFVLFLVKVCYSAPEAAPVYDIDEVSNQNVSEMLSSENTVTIPCGFNDFLHLWKQEDESIKAQYSLKNSRDDCYPYVKLMPGEDATVYSAYQAAYRAFAGEALKSDDVWELEKQQDKSE